MFVAGKNKPRRIVVGFGYSFICKRDIKQDAGLQLQVDEARADGAGTRRHCSNEDATTYAHCYPPWLQDHADSIILVSFV